MNARAFGPQLTRDGVLFRLWAPAANSVEVMLDQPYPMERDKAGWFSTTVKGTQAGTRYRFRIDGELDVPDPASQFQPDDIAGPSQVVDHDTYTWKARNWLGRPWEEAVFLEAHVSTYTQDGSYRAMIDKLDHLTGIGVTALELMPLADFPGRWNWGYDGVLWYAPDSTYGKPDDLKALIDAAHQRGLMVFLDVVYNHFGPEGNYLGRYAPQFFCDSHTPWGHAIDYRDETVRQFVIQNALHWLRDYRFDGLRLDAVHAIIEHDSAPLLRELSEAAGRLAKETGRHIHLVLENDDNASRLLDPLTDPPGGRFRAQWNDDYHHAWHVLLSGERHGYYEDYPKPHAQLARALEGGFIYQGEPSPHRQNEPRGEASGHLPTTAFVNFLQNHDQIGNRVLGDRLETNAKSAAMEAALAVTMLTPMPPMLFMGEEWGTTRPFPFFCDFQGDLAEAVREGRRKEFRAAYDAFGGDIPDPLDARTFALAKLDWQEAREQGRTRTELIRSLLAVRAKEIAPRLRGARFGKALAKDEGFLAARWQLGGGEALYLEANLCDLPRTSAADPGARLIWGTSGDFAPWQVRWSIGDV
ncbi:MAG: malto-oligosyltrehalose trehalohydrolase [Xanthobacteraceae bacterium]|nr:malto-oligosyltrehalose trehalohydrolase [Xanthobacteraceae bacterium]